MRLPFHKRNRAGREPRGDLPFDPRNFWSWVGYQFFYRIGWQFKMEATLMAGLVSWLSASPVVMGIFTTVNSVGRCLSPLAAAPLVDAQPRKQRALLMAWGLTVAVWAVLTAFLWLPVARARAVTLWVFAACYTLFFAFLGATNVAQGTLLGKIIPAEYRGRAMAVGMQLSGMINVGILLFTYSLVSGGRFPEPLNYALSFSFTVLFFLVAGGALLLIREPPSPAVGRSAGMRHSLQHAWLLTRKDANLRRLMLVNLTVMIGGNLLQFYTGFWRETGGLTERALLLATICQVGWQSFSSAVLGRVADRRGNRIIICALLWVEALVPLAALLLGSVPGLSGSYWFLLVYTLVGIRFPLYQLLVNYLLEAVPQEDHAVALGAVNAVQILASPVPLLYGLLAQTLGYGVSFVIASATVAAGAILALELAEPRNATRG